MNSPPSKRYRAAKAPMTPISESALEIGCFCAMRFMAQTTAIAAKSRKRIASIVSQSLLRIQRHDQRRHEQVHQRDWEHKCPGKSHQLIVAEPRKSAANPYINEQNRSYFRRKPEDWKQRHGDNRNQKYR